MVCIFIEKQGLKGEIIMANFVYKRTEQKSMKIAGLLNTSTMTINVDGNDKSLSTLFSPFSDFEVEINIKVKEEEELDEPTSDKDDEE